MHNLNIYIYINQDFCTPVQTRDGPANPGALSRKLFQKLKMLLAPQIYFLHSPGGREPTPQSGESVSARTCVQFTRICPAWGPHPNPPRIPNPQGPSPLPPPSLSPSSLLHVAAKEAEGAGGGNGGGGLLSQLRRLPASGVVIGNEVVAGHRWARGGGLRGLRVRARERSRNQSTGDAEGRACADASGLVTAPGADGPRQAGHPPRAAHAQ